MATKNEALRNKMADDFGAIWTSGKLQLQLADDTVAVEYALPASSLWQTPTANGKIDMDCSGAWATETSSVEGRITKARIQDQENTRNIEGLTVDSTAAHIIVDNPEVVIGQEVKLNSFSWTEASGVDPEA